MDSAPTLTDTDDPMAMTGIFMGSILIIALTGTGGPIASMSRTAIGTSGLMVPVSRFVVLVLIIIVTGVSRAACKAVLWACVNHRLFRAIIAGNR